MNDSMVGDPAKRKRFGHPIGLFVLFFTEFWERFYFYGMRAILVLYLVARTMGDENPGLGWIESNAYALYGWYLMFVYAMSIPGGLIADKLLGQKRTIMLGGWLLCAGHLTLTIQATWAFYLGLILIILGVGCLKPNVSTLVGSFWIWWGKRRRLSTSIFKMAIGIIIQGIGFFFMSAAAVQYRVYGASSMLFLVLFYLFSTLGELCVLPVSLSFTTKMAPLRWGSFFMGAYFAATGLGDKLGGLIAQSTAYFAEFEVFTGIAVCSVLFGLLAWAIVKPLKRLAHGFEDVDFAEGIGLQTEIE